MYKCLSALTIALIVALCVGAPVPTHAQSAVPQTVTCANLLVNGDMERDDGWILNAGLVAARYGNGAFSGVRSLQIGPSGDPALGGKRWSAAVQPVVLPAGQPATLSFQYRYQTAPAASGDQQQVALLDAKGTVLAYLLADIQPTATWRTFSTDLSAYAGRTVQLYFAVASDGASGQTHLTIDDVSLCDPQSVAPKPVVVVPPKPVTGKPPTEPAPAAAPAPAPAIAVPATTPISPTTVPLFDPANIVPLRGLGLAEQTLRRPQDGSSLAFGLPATWKLSAGASLQLEFDTFSVNTDSKADPNSTKPTADTLNVAFNNTVLAKVPLEYLGGHTVTIPIPDAALAPAGNAGQHLLAFTLAGGPDCAATQQVGVIIQPSSRLLLPHSTAALAADLSTLSQALVQQSFAPAATTVVVPDKATAAELQAALSAVAGLGRMSGGTLGLTLTPVSKLAPEVRSANNLIFVGSAAYPDLGAAKLPAPISGKGYAAPDAKPDDGIVQMVASPWNAARVVVIVTGSNDAAVIKAGRAVSTGTLRGTSQPNLALVADVHSDVVTASVTLDRSFADLGYRATTLSATGGQQASYRFDLPPQQAVNGDAYLDLTINHSTQLDYDRSNATVTLNGQSIRTIRFSDTTAPVNTVRVIIPDSAVRAGSNELLISGTFEASDPCNNARNTLGLTIWPDSNLHLPLASTRDQQATQPDLKNYPSPFATSGTLDKTAFVLAVDDPSGWNAAAAIALNLGAQLDDAAVNLAVAFGDAIPKDMWEARDMIIVGRPSSLAVLSKLKDVLPAPFEQGSDVASERTTQVAYRQAQGTSVGYLEQVAAPWNADRTVLAVLGSTAEGMQWASAALTQPALQSKLAGQLAVVNGTQVTVGTGAVPQAAVTPSAVPNVAGQPAQTAPASDTSTDSAPRRSRWLLPLIIVCASLMLLIIAYVALTSWRQRTLSRAK